MGEMEGHHFELNKTHKRQISNVLPQIWEQKLKKNLKKKKNLNILIITSQWG